MLQDLAAHQNKTEELVKLVSDISQKAGEEKDERDREREVQKAATETLRQELRDSEVCFYGARNHTAN